MADDPHQKHNARERLVVSGPTRDRLYDLFRRLFVGRDDVEVIKDQRLAQRRRREATPAEERRSRERRECSSHKISPPEPPA